MDRDTLIDIGLIIAIVVSVVVVKVARAEEPTNHTQIYAAQSAATQALEIEGCVKTKTVQSGYHVKSRVDTDTYSIQPVPLTVSCLKWAVVNSPPAPDPIEPLPTSKSLSISWTLPSSRENGDPLPSGEIGGYEILHKEESALTFTSNILTDSSITNYVIEGLEVGTYEVKIATFDSEGLYSDFVTVTATVVE